MPWADAAPTVRPLLYRLLGPATARASEVLRDLSGRPIHVSATDVSLYPGRAADGLAGLDRTMVGVHLSLTGALVGRALFSLTPGSAGRLSAMLLKDQHRTEGETAATLGPLAISAIEEVGNVTVTAVANELSLHLGRPVRPSVPTTEIRRGRDIIDDVVRDMKTDSVLVAQMLFTNHTRDIEAMLLVLFRADAHAASGDVGGVAQWRRSW